MKLRIVGAALAALGLTILAVAPAAASSDHPQDNACQQADGNVQEHNPNCDTTTTAAPEVTTTTVGDTTTTAQEVTTTTEAVIDTTTTVFVQDDAPVTTTTDAPSHPHKVWVCKYVGQPGDFETLKPGKNPISVDDSAAGFAVGDDFADGQFHSYVIALNPENDNEYTGEATCPTPPTTTTSTPTSEPTTTTVFVPTSTTVQVTTSTVAPSTSSVPSSTAPPSSGPTTSGPKPSGPDTSVSSPGSQPPASLPYTGSDTGTWVLVGIAALLLGAGLIAVGKARK